MKQKFMLFSPWLLKSPVSGVGLGRGSGFSLLFSLSLLACVACGDTATPNTKTNDTICKYCRKAQKAQ